MDDDTHTHSKNTTDKQGFIRFDFLFSYWIIAWFLLYYFIDPTTSFGKIFQKYGNPKLAFYLALIENIVTLLWIILVSNWIIVIKYICMIFIVKILPLYLIWNKPIRLPNDLYVFLGAFAIYNLYLYANDESLISIYRRTFTSIMNRDNKTPLFGFIIYLGNLFYIDKSLLAWF